MLYKINSESVNDSTVLLRVAFGEPANNDAIVREVAETAKTVSNSLHGKVVLINGAASLPVAMVLAHAFGHVTKAIAVYDPKMAKYVVTISHDPEYPIGKLID